MTGGKKGQKLPESKNSKKIKKFFKKGLHFLKDYVTMTKLSARQ